MKPRDALGLLLVIVLAFLVLMYVPAPSFGGGEPHAVPVYVVNRSQVPTWKLNDYLPAFQAALDEDFGPVWNVYGRLELVDQLPEDGMGIELVDVADLNCFLCAGYHELIGHRPHSIVGVGTGVPWPLVFTHEAEEMLVDPYIDRASFLARCSHYTCTSDAFYLVEVADPVESVKFAYTRTSPRGRGVLISDFVTPAWYTEQGGDLLDFTGHVHRHHEILDGGYIFVNRNGSWDSIDKFGRSHGSSEFPSRPHFEKGEPNGSS